MSSLHLRRFKAVMFGLLVTVALCLGANPATWTSPSQSSVHAQTVPPGTQPGPVLPTDPNAPVTVPSEPLPVGAVREVVRPGVAATIASSDGQVAVQMPADALNFPGTAQISPVSLSDLPPATGTFQFAGQAVKIDLFDATGAMVIHPTFANPIQICMNVGSLPGSDVTIQYYDTVTQTWVSLPTTFDAASNMACTTVNHLGLFVLTVDQTAIHSHSVAPVNNTESFFWSWWSWLVG